MYYFTTSEGRELKIRFCHVGGKKGSIDKPGKAPKSTHCFIYDSEGTKLSEGFAKPVLEIAEVIPGTVIDMAGYYGRRFVRSIQTDDGYSIAILRGDAFQRKRGREESLKKALTTFDRETRKNAWQSVLRMIPAEVAVD